MHRSCSHHWPPYLLFFLGAILLYANSLHGPFQFDDIPAIVENSSLRHIDHPEQIYRFYPSRVIAFFSFALNYQLSKLQTFGYHLTNVLIHAINACLVYTLLLQTFRLWVRPEKSSPAFWAALIWMAHPLQTEAVTYIYQRVTSLSVLFILAALVLYIKSREAAGRRRRIGAFLASLSLFLLALETKELALIFPVMLILYEFFPARYPPLFSLFRTKKGTMLTGGLLLLAAGILISSNSSIFFQEKISKSHDGDVIHLSTYVATQFPVMMRYLSMFFFPVGQNIDHDVPLVSFQSKPFVLSLLAALIIAGAAMCSRKTRPSVSFGLLWFLASILYCFVPRDYLMFEHHMYFPSIGLALATAAVVDRMRIDRRFQIAIMILIVSALGILTARRNGVWSDPVKLWSDVIEKSPLKSSGYISLGRAYEDRGDFDAALVAYDQALALKPDAIEALINRGNIFKRFGLFDKALTDINRAMNLSSEFWRTHILNNRANLYLRAGEYDRALEDYNIVIRKLKTFPDAYNNRAGLYKRKGQYESALEDYNQAIKMDPDHATYLFNRGTLYALMKRYDNARLDLDRAIRLDPDFADAYLNRANVHLLTEDLTSALDDVDRALVLDPSPKTFRLRSKILQMKREGAAR